jgi:hypothetical protein
VLSVGLGLETPTGSDATAIIGRTRYTFENEAFHFAPFLAWMQTPGDCTFRHAFVQLDIPANGDTVDFRGLEPGGPTGSFGKYNEQTLLHVNLSTGVWLFREECAPVLTGLAALAELHYTTALQDTDVIARTRAIVGGGTAMLTYRNGAGRFDVLNLSSGLHFELGRATTVRAIGVFPITDGDDRFFDAEFSLQIGRKF